MILHRYLVTVASPRGPVVVGSHTAKRAAQRDARARGGEVVDTGRR